MVMFLIIQMYRSTLTLQLYCKSCCILIFGDDSRYKPDGKFNVFTYNVDKNINHHMLLL